MRGEPIRPQPKPVRKEKAKAWGARRRKRPAPTTAALAYPKPVSPTKTKHGRRDREWGYMHFCHHRGCELKLDRELQRVLGIRHRCEGPNEFAHLSDLKRYDVGDVGAVLCRDNGHRAIDGKTGGKATWYSSRDQPAQHMIRMRLANRPRLVWDAMTPEQREDWERRAAAIRRAA